MPTKFCPNCGEEIPAKAKACPGCGSDEKTGWSEETRTDGLDLPDDSFDYNEYIKREFGSRKAIPYGQKKFWWIVAVLLLLAFLWAGFHWLF